MQLFDVYPKFYTTYYSTLSYTTVSLTFVVWVNTWYAKSYFLNPQNCLSLSKLYALLQMYAIHKILVYRERISFWKIIWCNLNKYVYVLFRLGADDGSMLVSWTSLNPMDLVQRMNSFGKDWDFNFNSFEDFMKRVSLYHITIL